MNKHVLLGIGPAPTRGAIISPAMQHMLRAVSKLIEESSPSLHLVLLHVIPLPYATSPSLSMYMGHVQALAVTPEQHSEAELLVEKTRTELQNLGIASSKMEILIRTGVPADEIVRAAKELRADLIVVGSHGDTFLQKLRRFCIGSTSRKVLHLAPCPVMIVAPPRFPHPSDLVAWYEDAITRYLNENTSTLTVFTPQEAAQMFAPPGKKAPGRKERAAAILALEQLARTGILCRHDVKGELLYVND